MDIADDDESLQPYRNYDHDDFAGLSKPIKTLQLWGKQSNYSFFLKGPLIKPLSTVNPVFRQDFK